MTGVVLLFYFMGIIVTTETINSTILTAMIHPETLKDSAVYVTIIAFITAGTLVAAIVGFFTKNMDYAIRTPIGLYLLSLMYDFAIVLTKMMSTGILFGILGVLLFSPLIIMWVFVVVDYIGGRD
jgi:hypothetical protein